MTIPSLLDASLIGGAGRPALEWHGQILTFGDLESRSNRTARFLLNSGLEPGDRLCVQLPNSIEFIDLYLACVKTGILFVPVNVLYRDREVSHILSNAEPKLFVTDPAQIAGAHSFDPTRPEARLETSTPTAIVYTSGTTGASKGAVLTHGNWTANARNLIEAWRITAEDRLLLPLPLFHVHGLGNGLHCWLASGCRLRLLERFEHAKAAAEFLDFQPTLFFGVPAIYLRLLDIAVETARRMSAHMRLFVSGSAPLPAQVLEDFRARYGHTILERYGMSETLMNMSNPYGGERRPGTVGMPLPNVEARLIDGEVQLKGPNVFPGYWRDPQATAEAFDDGWFKTGDMATCSDDGYYTLHGRRTDLIISGGFNIYPREIEELLLEQPGVREAAVAAIPDRIRGEVPVAYVAGDFDAAHLEAVCRHELASFKLPREFIKVDTLPRTALGKVQKHLLPRPSIKQQG
ncbi:MAG: AMP-binding protein [Acidimicrobiia bacterium]|nr:AMP-binding protein [Acidimicrobiia bacterium]